MKRTPSAALVVASKAQAPARRSAIPLADPISVEEARSEEHAAREAAARCACVIAGFFTVMPEALLKPTRGTADEAFARQFLIAGLVLGLGFSREAAAHAVGRSVDTIDHACMIISALRFNMDAEELAELLGDQDLQEFFGDLDGAREFIQHAQPLVDDLFAAFALVTVRGGAYCRERSRLKQQRGKR